jgi:hypothetical protein
MTRSTIRSKAWIGGTVVLFSIASCRSKEPRLTISSPEESTRFTQGDTIHFAADLNSNVDPGVIPYQNWHWASDLDGELGRAPRVDVTSLRVGKHDVTLTVRHRLGESSAHVTFFVDAPRQNK